MPMMHLFNQTSPPRMPADGIDPNVKLPPSVIAERRARRRAQ